MKLSAPRQITWIIAVALGVLGILEGLGTLDVPSVTAFFLVGAGFVLLALATLYKDL